MGNRIIKESICTSETIEELGWFDEVFFYRLIVSCDDYGIMDARPKILKARLFPLRDITLDEIKAALRVLMGNGLIRMYTVGGKPYLQVITWTEHQRIRDSKHKYPMPDEADPESEAYEEDAERGEMPQDAESCGELRRVAASCGEPPRDAARARAESESESESESKTNPTRARARERPDMDAFGAFWDEYPNKKAKQDAIRAWKKLKPDAALINRIMAGLAKAKNSDSWLRDEGRFIPYPATWLNGRRWEDEVTTGHAPPRVPAQQYSQRDYSVPMETVEEMMTRLNGGVKPGA